MHIGNEHKAIVVERIGGPAQPNEVKAPEPVKVPVAAEAEVETQELVTA